jgi:hypothetical protein
MSIIVLPYPNTVPLPNQKIISPLITLPNGMTEVLVSLNCSTWATGNGTVDFGLEASLDSGVTWVLMGATTFTIGTLNKGLYLPTIGISRLDTIVGALWRVYVKATTAIKIQMLGDFLQWLSGV